MKNNKIQKVVLIVVLIATILLFMSSLLYVHEAWIRLEYVGDRSTFIDNCFKSSNSLNWTSVVFSSASEAYQYYFDVWDQINESNQAFFMVGLISLIIVMFNYILGNQSRKKYYISNLVIGLILPVVTIVMSIIAISKCFETISDINYIANDLIYLQKSQSLSMAITSDPGYFAIIALAIYMIVTVLYAIFVVAKFIKTYPRLQKNDLENSIAEEDSASLDK